MNTSTSSGKLPGQHGVGVLAWAMAECRFAAIMTPIGILDKGFHHDSRP
jgi:hypothetical protein